MCVRWYIAVGVYSMKLVVCYARIDKQICSDLVPMLVGHDVWYDARDYTVDNWWETIIHRLDWCDVMIYLLSPESLESHYCRKEFEIALQLNKIIIPIILVDGLQLADELCDLHPVDLRNGWQDELAEKRVLKAIARAYRNKTVTKPLAVNKLVLDDIKLYSDYQLTPVGMIGRASDAMESGNYDNAVLLLKHAKVRGYSSRYIDVDSLLAEAESAFNRHVERRLMDLAYRNIAEQVKNKMTRDIGCEALHKFLEYHPLYDPENLVQLCESVVPETNISNMEQCSATPKAKKISLPLLEWCVVPTGCVVSTDDDVVHVRSFKIAKYPVTNTQYQMFVNDSDGYENPDWWRFSQYAFSWFKNRETRHDGHYAGDDRPRENITWYEAMAYCNWLSAKFDVKISLPTCRQWRRAAQGDDGRLYPWGNDFNKDMCNTRESRTRQTTSVLRYEGSASPYGVMDMAGNVWEWCIDPINGMSREVVSNEPRALQGGSFITSAERAQSTFRFHLDPTYFYATIGFRLVLLE